MAEEKSTSEKAGAKKDPAVGKGRDLSLEAERGEFMSGEEALEAGYFGAKPKSEYENEEYALTSGPDSPPYPMGKG